MNSARFRSTGRKPADRTCCVRRQSPAGTSWQCQRTDPSWVLIFAGHLTSWQGHSVNTFLPLSGGPDNNCTGTAWCRIIEFGRPTEENISSGRGRQSIRRARHLNRPASRASPTPGERAVEHGRRDQTDRRPVSDEHLSLTFSRRRARRDSDQRHPRSPRTRCLAPYRAAGLLSRARLGGHRVVTARGPAHCFARRAGGRVRARPTTVSADEYGH